MTRNYIPTDIRQQQIVEAARKIIIRDGSEHLTIKKIAKTVGVSETDIYKHYKNKMQILNVLIDNIEQTIIRDFELGSIPDKTPLQILELVLLNHVSAIQQRRGLAFLVIAEIITFNDKQLNKKVATVLDKYHGMLEKLLTEAINSHEIKNNLDVKATAVSLYSIIQGLVSLWALDNYEFDLESKYISSWSIFKQGIICT
jgi:AcrR family transcriptional regulator